MAGGGRLQIVCTDNILNCLGAPPPVPTQDAQLFPFSFDLNAADMNGDGVITDPGIDRVSGHFNLTAPGKGGAMKIRAKALLGGFCSEFDTINCTTIIPTIPGPLGPRVSNLGASPKLQNFIKVHPKVGLGAFIGVYRLSGKNADSCESTPDSDCQLIVILAADLDNIYGPSNGDFVFVLDEYSLFGFMGVVQNGNLSITQEVVPAP